jgi:hypothetical protein
LFILLLPQTIAPRDCDSVRGTTPTIEPLIKENDMLRSCLALLFAVALAGSVAAKERGEEGSLHSSYVGQSGDFAIHRLEMTDFSVTLDLLLRESGERFLVVTNQTTGDIESFVLPKGRVRDRGTSEPTTQGTRTEPIIVRADRSGAWTVWADGILIGVLTISSNGETQFTPVSTGEK